MSSKVKASYLIAVVKFDFSIRMLEDLNKELPFLLKQYSRKKQKLSQKVLDGLDEKTKSEFKSLFLSVEEMQNLMKNVKDGEFLPPYEMTENKRLILGEMLVTLPMTYVFDGLIREMCLVYMITVFESFLENVLKITFEKCPECLSSSKSITFEEVVANLKSNKEILNALIEKETDEVLRYDIEKIDNYFHKKFNIRISGYVPDWNEFKERFYRRNILLHNLGIVNEEYSRKTGYKGEEKRLTVSEDYLEKSFQLFRLMSQKIFGAFYRKFEKES
jgi:hypothetical protein